MQKVLSGVMVGIDSCLVTVEARVTKGLPAFEIVGLPERGVRESRARIRAALDACGYAVPPRKILINLAPGDLRKHGAGLDLPIAIAILACIGIVEWHALEGILFLGELSLEGEVRHVNGVLSHLRMAKAKGVHSLILPDASRPHLLEVEGCSVRTFADLSAVVSWLNGETITPQYTQADTLDIEQEYRNGLDLREVRGQPVAKRALEIAASGGHNLLFVGPPGTGKSMLAARIPSILPPLTSDERIEVATIAGSIGEVKRTRPFRAPHQNASTAAMTGGGEPFRPGEVTLAHRGVLFLDELPEFRRDAIEALRTTLENGRIDVVRTSYRLELPANALVVAAMNPCPCGHAGDEDRLCACSPPIVERYLRKLSGPLLDRFDLQVNLGRFPMHLLRKSESEEASEEVRARVIASQRFGEMLRKTELERLDANAGFFLDQRADELLLSARGYTRSLRVANTIANLAHSEQIREEHIAEALRYRAFDQRLRRMRGTEPKRIARPSEKRPKNVHVM